MNNIKSQAFDIIISKNVSLKHIKNLNTVDEYNNTVWRNGITQDEFDIIKLAIESHKHPIINNVSLIDRLDGLCKRYEMGLGRDNDDYLILKNFLINNKE